jgi:phospholipid transport system substrate-binding protein
MLNKMRLTLIALLCLAFASPAFAGGDEAKKYVDVVAQDALSVIKESQSKKITEDQAKTKFRNILNKSFDIPAIAKFTLGRYWRVATPAERTEYTNLLQNVILSKYADRMLDYTGNGYTITGVRNINDKMDEVAMNLRDESGTLVAFNWMVRKTDKGLRVVDLSVEGISMGATHRDDFASVIESNGGKVQALLDALKQKKVGSKS